MSGQRRPKVRDAWLGVDFFTAMPYLQCPNCSHRSYGDRLATARDGLRHHIREVHVTVPSQERSSDG